MVEPRRTVSQVRLCALTDLTQAAEGFTSQEVPRESSPFESLATKLGLPTNCDIDLRKQEEMEVNFKRALATKLPRVGVTETLVQVKCSPSKDLWNS